MTTEWWHYDELESGEPYDNWEPASRGDHPDDNIDFHIDLGAGTLPKGRLTIDSRGEPDILMDLDTMKLMDSVGPLTQVGKTLPFPDDSIESIVSHHCLEHIGTGFLRLMDECYRVLKPGGKFRIIVPLFPSFSAISDPDHVRYFCVDTFDSFVHDAPMDVPFWAEAFSSPYTSARFKLTDKDYTPPEEFYVQEGNTSFNIDDLFAKGREIRVTYEKPLDTK
jgi:SAM-dependent methyltransferase